MTRPLAIRTGADRRTGRLLTGFAHVRQSLEVIWLTRLGERVMRLDFGSDVRALLGEDLSPQLALLIYDSLIAAAHAHEPEFRISSLQFVRLSASGVLALKFTGTYYPEGRLGNYVDAVTVTDAAAIGLPTWLARGARAAA